MRSHSMDGLLETRDQSSAKEQVKVIDRLKLKKTSYRDWQLVY